MRLPAFHRLASFGLPLLLSTSAQAASTGWEVKVLPGFFNPTIGQTAAFEVTGPGAGGGELRAEILDRDRFVVRELPRLEVAGWPTKLTWDGRGEDGAVVPNEAYVLRLTLRRGKADHIFDPSRDFHPVVEQPAERYYSAVSGVLSYRLSRASRVHIQAGQASPDPKTGELVGPILKTVVDREPRVSGPIAETWTGYDESGTVAVHALPHMGISIFATSLPDASVITVGSRGPAFREYALRKKPRPAARVSLAAETSAAHHAGLTSIEDVSPVLALTVEASGTRDGVPIIGESIGLTVKLPDHAKVHFAHFPAKMRIFLDERIALEVTPKDGMRIRVQTGDLAPGEHRVVANWATALGPVGVGVARVTKHEAVLEGAQR